MKQRNGFVSNSSSSSFIVTYKEKIDETKVATPLNFGQLMQDHISNNVHSYESELLADGRQDVIDFIQEKIRDYDHDGYDASYWQDKLLQIQNLPAEDVPLLFNMSYHDEMFAVVLKVYQDNGYVTVLDRES